MIASQPANEKKEKRKKEKKTKFKLFRRFVTAHTHTRECARGANNHEIVCVQKLKLLSFFFFFLVSFSHSNVTDV